MGNLALSQHAIIRMAQRGIDMSDIDLIMAIGSEVDDGVFVRRKDVEALEHGARSLLRQLKRVRSKRLVLAQDCLVTAYHASRPEEHRLLWRN